MQLCLEKSKNLIALSYCRWALPIWSIPQLFSFFQWLSCTVSTWESKLSPFLNVCKASSTQQAWAREQLETQIRNWNAPCCSVAIWSQDKKKFHYSISLCNWVMMGLYSPLTRFSWKLMSSSQSFPYLEADYHCGTYACLPIPPDIICSNMFFRDCALHNGPAIHCEFLKQVAFLRQLYRKREKRMK